MFFGYIRSCNLSQILLELNACGVLIFYFSTVHLYFCIAGRTTITSCGAKAQQTPSPCCARAVSRNWPKMQSERPVATPHLPWKFHANRSSRFLVILLTKRQRYKQTKKSIENNTPSPDVSGKGQKCWIIHKFHSEWISVIYVVSSSIPVF